MSPILPLTDPLTGWSASGPPHLAPNPSTSVVVTVSGVYKDTVRSFNHIVYFLVDLKSITCGPNPPMAGMSLKFNSMPGQH